ncbi:endo alpha-1,4 polygalactosaminidase [Candidatus Bathyarchaeota archaeon]|nr:endo alpha-1,4 polygalactosaminidase [Candidatus Bathyarchaeota archaeon]
MDESLTYVEDLAATAHATMTTRGLPLMFGQKNAPHLAPYLVNTVDFAVLEDCQGLNWRFPGMHESFCHDFQAFVTGQNRTDGSPLPVFEIEYPGSVGDGSEELSVPDFNYYCGREERLVGNIGFSQIIKHESGELDGWAQYCRETERLGRVRTATLPIGDALRPR